MRCNHTAEKTIAVEHSLSELTALIQLVKSHTTERSDARKALPGLEKARAEMLGQRFKLVSNPNFQVRG